jgi:GLPGLI family protein
MKALLSIFLFSFSTIFTAQEGALIVKYSYFNEKSASKENEFAELLHSQNKSLFTIYTKKIAPNTSYIDENHKIKGDLIDYKEEVFKDFDQNHLYAKSSIPFTMKLTVKDTLNNLVWTITDLRKEIMGYNCIEAKTSFHGRKYTAFFTESIPIFDGPWKFSGLPGLILELKEETGVLEVIAYEIKSENIVMDIQTSLDTKNAFFWTDLIEKAKIHSKTIVNEWKKDDPSAGVLIDSNNSLEIFGIINE